VRLAELGRAGGFLDEALADAEVALQSAEQAGSRVGAARAHALAGDVFERLGDTAEAMRRRTAALAGLRTIGDRRSAAELLLAMAAQDLADGEPGRARARVLEARALADALEWRHGRERALRLLALLERHTADAA
jgi:tetratricopeptide (TPR) repeat protein